MPFGKERLKINLLANTGVVRSQDVTVVMNTSGQETTVESSKLSPQNLIINVYRCLNNVLNLEEFYSLNITTKYLFS